jgi:hypothetical protein
MRHRRFDWYERIKTVEREYWSARKAVDQLSAAVARDPSALGEGRTPRDLRSAGENLEGTYLVRLFAVFETGVRSFWKTIKPRARTQAETLLDRVGDRCGVPADVIAAAHSARKYRNSLLHEHEEDVEVVSISAAQRCFQIYLSRMPNEWGR